MASVVTPFLATFAHPVYPQRSRMINALTLDEAEQIAADSVAGSSWSVVRVIPFVASTG